MIYGKFQDHQISGSKEEDFNVFGEFLPYMCVVAILIMRPEPFMQVKSMQRSATEAIRTQLQPSKPKREITNITKSQNTTRTYGQPSEQLFPKR